VRGKDRPHHSDGYSMQTGPVSAESHEFASNLIKEVKICRKNTEKTV
jgi:hypothetical protein